MLRIAGISRRRSQSKKAQMDLVGFPRDFRFLPEVDAYSSAARVPLVAGNLGIIIIVIASW